jgi:nucleoside-diphosphate-sugar epimerase
MNKVIITGARGFVGSYLLKYLKKKNFNVIGLSRRKNCKLYYIKDYLQIKKEPAFLIYLSEESNIFNFNKLSNLQIKKKQKVLKVLSTKFKNKFIYASSSKVYSDKLKIKLKETSEIRAENKYEKNKIQCEKIVLKNKGVVLRISNIYGNKIKKESIFLKIIRQIKNKNKNLYLNNTNHIRDFLYIDDLLRLIELVIYNPKTGIYNVGSGRGLSIFNLLELIFKIFKKKKRIVVKNSSINFSCQILNISKAYKIFNWKPKFSIYKQLGKVIKKYD